MTNKKSENKSNIAEAKKKRPFALAKPLADNQMTLTEKHVFKRTHRFYKELDFLCTQSKDLYNVVLKMVNDYRTENEGKVPGLFYLLTKITKEHTPEYYVIASTKIAKGTVNLLSTSFRNWLKAVKEWEKNPWKFKAPNIQPGEKPPAPNPPDYKRKPFDRFTTMVNKEGLSKVALKKTEKEVTRPSGEKAIHHCSGTLKINNTSIEIPLNRATFETIRDVKIVPSPCNYYTVYVSYVYTKTIDPNIDYDRMAAIDLGVSNLAGLISNVKEFRPVLVNGRPLKSINQFYAMRKAKLQSELEPPRKTSWEIKALTRGRDMRVNNYMHQCSRYIINLLLEHKIGTLVIGKNPDWKQAVALGRANNQNFVSIPHGMLINQLQYKAEMVGIKTYIVEESHTSKCSFFDNEEICHHDKNKYLGKRDRRLFWRPDGTYVNADINGAGNVLRKRFPDAFKWGVEHIKQTPLKVTPASHPTRPQTPKERNYIEKYSQYNL